jgi:dihydrofolate reductase
VFSTTLATVEQGFTLISGDAVELVAAMKQEPGKDLAVGGAGLAATFVKAGLVDEYRLLVSPVVLGGGTPFFPALEQRIELELLETRTFGSRVLYLRYARAA